MTSPTTPPSPADSVAPPATPSPKPAPNPFITGPDDSPTPTPTGAPTPGDEQKKKIFIILGGAIVFLVLIGIVPLLVLRSNKGRQNSPSPTPILVASKSPDMQIASLSQRVFLKTSSSQQTLPYDLTMEVPSSWQARFSAQTTVTYPWANSLLVTSLLTGYSGLSSTNLATASNNYLALMDITSWLTVAQKSPSLSAVSKQQWYGGLTNINQDTKIETVAQLPNPSVGTEYNGRQLPQILNSKDDNLHGIAYLTQLKNGTYEPTIIVMLAGTVGGRNITLYGQHNVRDKLWSTLAQAQSTSDPSFVNNRDSAVADFQAGKITDDTKAIFNELVKSIQTIQIKSASPNP